MLKRAVAFERVEFEFGDQSLSSVIPHDIASEQLAEDMNVYAAFVILIVS